MNITNNEIDVNIFRGNGFMTICKYNKNGDLLFIADKDTKDITVINIITKSILGIYRGHNGVIWNLDITEDSKTLISVSGDMSIIKWDVLTGNYKKIITKSIPKYISIFSEENKYVVLFDPISKRSKASFQIFNLETDEILFNYDEETNLKRFTTINWLNTNKLFITYDNGEFIVYNIENNTIEQSKKIHTDFIKSVSFNKDKTKLITASIDTTCKIINLENFEIEKTFENIVPCNCAVFSPIRNYVIIGGGLDAMLVAQKANNDFTSRFFSCNTGKYVGCINGHFGPIRYININPNGKNYASASQDGTIRIYYFNDDHHPKKLCEQINTDILDLTNLKLLQPSDENILKKETNFFLYNTNQPVLNTKISTIEKNNITETIKKKEEIQLYTFTSKKFIDPVSENKFNYHDTFAIKVTNLPEDIEYHELMDLFEFFGRIKERGVNIKKYKDDTVAFINYLDKSCADKATQMMNGHRLGYQIIKVEPLTH
jgi:translation initiation factor 3 subunit I